MYYNIFIDTMICSKSTYSFVIFGTTAVGFWMTATANTFIIALYGLGLLGIAAALSYQANEKGYESHTD